MIFFFKSDGTLIKSAPETVYQGSEEAGKVYVVAPLNANMLVDVYYELPNGERWGAYLLENNGTVINNEESPDGWALWSTTLESAITQYAGTLKAQFGFYQSGTADKVPLITSQGVTITIAKGVVRDLPSVPTADVYAQIVNAISSIKQDIANLPNEYLSNTNEDKIALKNNSAIEYSENSMAGTIVKRDIDGKINVAEGTEDLNAVNLGQFNAALANKVSSSSVSATAVKDTIAQRTATGQLKAVDGVTDDDLATVKQLNAVKQGNYSDITNVDLNTGDTTVEYDTGLGITVNAKGTLTHKNGSTEQPTTKFEVPIIAGAGVSLDKKENEEKIEIKSLNSNLENGTANVLIQTTDTNHSFKVMTDGRAKVKSAPIDYDDVVRKYELDTKFDKTNIVQATGDSTTEVMSQKAVTDELNKTNNSLADLKEALYGYVLDTAEVETDSVIPSTVEVGGNTYNLVDGVRGLVKEIKGGTVNSDGLKSVEYTGLEVKGKNLLSFPYYGQYETKQGITFSKVSTYKVNASGINTGSTGCTFDFNYNKVFEAGTYTIKFYTEGSVPPELYYRIRKDSYYGGIIISDKEFQKTFTLSEDSVLFISFGIYGTESPQYTGKKININVWCQIEKGDTATDYKPYREPVNILPFTTTLRGVDTYKDRIIITKNESDDYYTATKETNCEVVDYTSGDEDNVEYITDLTTTVKPLETPTTEVLSTTLTESDVMPLLELGGSVEIINENSLYVTGSTALEMVYKLINNTATSEVTE